MEDLPWIVSLYNATIPGGMVTADTEPVSPESRVDWFSRHDPDTRPLWIAEIDDTPRGWVSFQSFYGRPAYRATAEIAIYIAEDMRGKGLGRFLLAQALQTSPRLGIRTLLGFIFAHNLASLALFASLGFDIWGRLPRVAEIAGVERDLVITGKRTDVT